MHLIPLSSVLLYLLSTTAPAIVAAASDKPLKPCTAISPTTQRFFDLNHMHRTKPDKDSKKKGKEADEGSWHARGYDYGANFTLNFCGPVVEDLDSVVDLDKDARRNVSAYYEQGGKTYAIG
jgi:cation-dependent mannose-6-phosphate receptor